jgi:hypothetical protein
VIGTQAFTQRGGMNRKEEKQRRTSFFFWWVSLKMDTELIRQSMTQRSDQAKPGFLFRKIWGHGDSAHVLHFQHRKRNPWIGSCISKHLWSAVSHKYVYVYAYVYVYIQS